MPESADQQANWEGADGCSAPGRLLSTRNGGTLSPTAERVIMAVICCFRGASSVTACGFASTVRHLYVLFADSIVSSALNRSSEGTSWRLVEILWRKSRSSTKYPAQSRCRSISRLVANRSPWRVQRSLTHGRLGRATCVLICWARAGQPMSVSSVMAILARDSFKARAASMTSNVVTHSNCVAQSVHTSMICISSAGHRYGSVPPA